MTEYVKYQANATTFPVVSSTERDDVVVIGHAATLEAAQIHLDRFYQGTGAAAKASWGDREVGGKLMTVIEGR